MGTDGPPTKSLMRCPRCDRAMPVGENGECPACGKTSLLDRWRKRTERLPIQPEEERGGRCLECGEPVDLLLAYRLNIWVFGIASAAGGAFAMVTLVITRDGPIQGWVFLILMLAITLASLPAKRLADRFGEVPFPQSTTVACRGCGFVRVGDRAGSEIERTYWNGRRRFDAMFLWCTGFVGFFGAVWAGGALIGERVPRAAILSFGIAVAAWLGIGSHRRLWHPRRWRLF